MKALITGVTGFVGRHLASHLLSRGWEVAGISSDPLHTVPGVELFRVDLLDRHDLVEAVRSADPRAIVHLGGLSHVGASWQSPGEYQRVNFTGTRYLLHAAGERPVIFASSSEVYGFVPEDEQPIQEDRALDPRSPYAITKACAEGLALDHGAIVARSFNAIGPGQSPHFAMPSFAAQLAAIQRKKQEATIRVGDLSPRRDFLHVADVAEAYRILIERGEAQKVYNLASGEDRSIAEALDLLQRISGVEAVVVRDPERVRPVDIPVLRGDGSRMRALGWQPALGLEEALRGIWAEALEKPTS